MIADMTRLGRRAFLRRCAAVTALAYPTSGWSGATPAALSRLIPRTGEVLPVIGMGTYRTFHVGKNPAARAQRIEVLKAFFAAGGGLVDSSPMYGFSELVVGDCLRHFPADVPLFAATKVWTFGRALGISQMQNSEYLWGVERFDLMQIHNLLDWETHLPTLKSWREAGRIRYLGVTTSHGSNHQLLARVLATGAFDFVQLTYNVIDREVERRLLPLAADLGIAVIVNRPFQGGRLFVRVATRPLPDWAREFGCRNWAQFFLQYVVSHPAVTCAIPATSQPAHMRENMAAGTGRVLELKERARMARLVEDLV